MDDWIELKPPIKGEGISVETVNHKSMRTTEITTTFFEVLGTGAFNRLKASSSPMFHVDLGEEPVYTTFLDHLSPDLRNENMCSICRSFAKRYGNLALVRDDGTLEPVLWSTKDLKRQDMQEKYGPSVKAIQRRFEGKKVVKDFNVAQRQGITRLKTLGTVTENNFSHMYLHQPDSRIPKTHTPCFKAASVSDQAAMLDRVLTNYDVETIRKANWILQDGRIPYALDYRAPCQWLLDLSEQRQVDKAQGAASRHNLLYRNSAGSFIATRKQIQSRALSILLENVKNNSAWSVLLSEWIWVCGRAEYLRHGTAISNNHIKPADYFLDELGNRLTDSKHRLCVQNDVPEDALMWASTKMRPQQTDEMEQANTETSEARVVEKGAPIASGCFTAMMAWLKPTKAVASGVASPRYETIGISLSDFVTKVLPEAKQVAYFLYPWESIVTFISGMEDPKPISQSGYEGEDSSITAFVTLQSDSVEARSLEEYNLSPFEWIEVRCLIPFPDLWDDIPLATDFLLTDRGSEEDSTSEDYRRTRRFRYLFVLEGIHESSLARLTHSRKNIVKDKNQSDRESFVGGVSVHSTMKDLVLRFKVVNSAGQTKDYHINQFK